MTPPTDDQTAPPAARNGGSGELESLGGASRDRRERYPTPALAKATLAAVTAKPGLRIPELAVELGCFHNPLYAILAEHQRQERVVKSGQRWYSFDHGAPKTQARKRVVRRHARTAGGA